ncbi:MAG: zinc-binding dehydrogenase [Leptospirales bacterium]|nr:zinc-binding dehydrogenase [Leptospirales bacterium]
MRALELKEYSEQPRLDLLQKKLPALKPGQLLIKISAASINPSDLHFLEGKYGIKKKLPVVPGFEAAGTVVAHRAGFRGSRLVGKRVACAAGAEGDGVWAEYAAIDQRFCFPLLNNVSDEAGAAALVNPLTAWAMLDMASERKARAIVQNAAAGALGRMLFRLGRRRGLQVINIVRRPEQAAILKGDGAEHILLSSDSRFERELLTLSRKLGATVAYDAIAGEATEQLSRSMPPRSRIIVYGALSGEYCRIHPGMLIFRNSSLEGFWLSTWMSEVSPSRLQKIARESQSLIGQELGTAIQARIPLSRGPEAVEQYRNNMSAGKVLILPGA